jgi:hypothetical protein
LHKTERIKVFGSPAIIHGLRMRPVKSAGRIQHAFTTLKGRINTHSTMKNEIINGFYLILTLVIMAIIAWVIYLPLYLP